MLPFHKVLRNKIKHWVETFHSSIDDLSLDTGRKSRRRSGVLIVNFEHISHLLVFLLLTLSK